MKEITLEATIENITQVTAFIDEELDAAGCPLKVRMRIDIAIDELFSNIARYAYTPETGMATVQLQLESEPPAATISFIDNGVPYNPLMQAEPDTSAPLKERRIGGLGIFMVKKSMDDLRYEYTGGKNIVTIFKRF